MSEPTIHPRRARSRIGRQVLIGVTALSIGLAGATGASAHPKPGPGPANPDLGPSVTIFDPSMPVADIKAKFDAITAEQFDNEFGPRRDAVYFLPGTYGTPEAPLNVQVGYYTEVAGLGASPTDVVINGTINVYNRCLEADETSNCLALTNFWRSMSNLTINVKGGLHTVLGEAAPRPDWCTDTEFWAVSQASPLRRVNINGGFSFMDYCSAGPQYASGGFMADSRSNAAAVVNGSQQQWYTRNSEITSWSNAVWNAVFSGVVGAPAETFPTPNPYTVLDTTPVSREKPYLFVDAAGKYQVRVPSAQTNSKGVSWAAGLTPGRTVPIKDFYVAKPGDSVQSINNALAKGQNLILTPGVYDVAKTIKVKRADTVVLGLGYATLHSVGGATPLEVEDVSGVVVAGVTVDAGEVSSAALVRVGKKNGHGDRSGAKNPTTLSDVFFRVGGPYVGRTKVALEVNSDNVLLDHAWVWRADHGDEGFPTDTVVRSDVDRQRTADGLPLLNDDDTRWVTNTAPNGLVVNGDNVTATGLFVEHFQQYNTVWNGENGTTIFYQNELPYDPRTQADWTTPAGTLGWAAYKVGDRVKKHSLFGGGAYVFNQNDPSVITENGFEVPTTPGVQIKHVMTVNLSQGTIRHVIDGVGTQADNTNTGTPQFVAQYPAP